MKLYTKSLTAIAASLALSAASTSAQTIVEGTTMTFDFGVTADASGTGVNNISAGEGLLAQDGSLTSVVDSANTTLTGVTFAWSRPIVGFNNRDAIVNGSSPAWVTSSIAESWMGANVGAGNVGFTLTISGLNTAFNYDLTMGAGFGGIEGNTTYTINGNGITNAASGSTPFITHQDVSSTAGTIVITGIQAQSAATISGLQIVAIPEPSSALLGGLGALALLRRRR